jgi:hypothetical protein
MAFVRSITMGSIIVHPEIRRRELTGGRIVWVANRWDAAGKWTGCGAHIRLKIAVASVRRPGDDLEVDSE